MTTSNARVQRITQEHETRRQQWQREKEAYIAEHGRKAWELKVELEVAELYDVKAPFPMPGEKP